MVVSHRYTEKQTQHEVTERDEEDNGKERHLKVRKTDDRKIDEDEETTKRDEEEIKKREIKGTGRCFDYFRSDYFLIETGQCSLRRSIKSDLDCGLGERGGRFRRRRRKVGVRKQQ